MYQNDIWDGNVLFRVVVSPSESGKHQVTVSAYVPASKKPDSVVNGIPSRTLGVMRGTVEPNSGTINGIVLQALQKEVVDSILDGIRFAKHLASQK